MEASIALGSPIALLQQSFRHVRKKFKALALGVGSHLAFTTKSSFQEDAKRLFDIVE
jgi:fluoride ion exporter CrcB/FEX